MTGLIDAQDWAAIAAAMARSHEPGDVWLRTFARNMLAIRQHRPALYAQLIEALPRFRSDETTLPALAARSDTRAFEIFDATQLLRQDGRTVALAGLGDGRVLRAHARFTPPPQVMRQQEIIVIEPDMNRLIAGLGCTDLTGIRGAFQQPRIGWCVGPDWIEQLSNDLIAAPTRIVPMRAEPSTVARPEIDAGIELIQKRVEETYQSWRDDVRAYYASFSDAELVDVLGPNPSRKPRVLMLTTQFSSVLQYSTYDSARAMRELGFHVLVATEAQLWHAMSGPSILAALATYKPDVVFQIDHLRYETKDLIPANLPFICWVQDHLANLTNEFAGKSITDRDFVLTGATYRYTSRYGYPRRQCIDMAKSSRPAELPASWTCDREDIFYVSHWSQRADAIIANMCERTRELAGPVIEKAMYTCCSDMMNAYEHGESFPTPLKVRALVRRVFDRLQLDFTPQLDNFFVDALYQRLNQVFYRQQALTWAAEITEELGLKFGIYGRGWETHPTLAKYARGTVQYGPELEALTRESKMLLQLEPYACYSHQRMLDALLAGGFALVRSHPFNTVPIHVRQFLDAYAAPELNSVDEVMESLAPPLQEQFKSLLIEAEDIAAMGDIVDVVRGWQRSGLIGDSDVALPCLGEISFHSKQSLKDCIVRFRSDDAGRRRIAAEQREAVMQRLTYYQTLKGAMRKIHLLLLDSHLNATSTDSIREAA